jgi:hypothetical protein
MTLTSKQLLDLYATPATTAGMAGRVESIKRASIRLPNGGYSLLTNRLRAHLATLAPKRAPQRHYDNPTAVVRRPAQQAAPLTAADIAWLQRLPSDPAEISYEDAHTLARMDATWPAGSPDARLVRSVLGPVRRYHDTKAAQVDLENLQATPLRNVNKGEAVELLREALTRETPELHEDEASLRAGNLLQEALLKAANVDAARLDAAKAKVAAAAKPFNPDDMADSPAYRELARVAAMIGDPAAGRAIRQYADPDAAAASDAA